MNVLLIGSGGREHALAQKIAASPRLTKLYALPGNPGIAGVAECLPAPAVTDNVAVTELARKKNIDLAVIGPEAPLANGLTDALTAAGIKVFGPTAQAARLESSKEFAKDLMREYNIPTAQYAVFDDAQKAKAYIKEHGAPLVIKADGLAAGKGVTVAMTTEEALAAAESMLNEKKFGAAGAKIIAEEFMAGEEASLLAFTDGTTVVPMLPAQDHKRAYDNDLGPNTGGMGAYAPAPVMTAEIVAETLTKILRPTVKALKDRGCPYCGCLYAGLMIVEGHPKVVEFNARFGDPETQVVLPLLDSDILTVMDACVTGKLTADMVKFSPGAAACVIMAAKGYPGAYEKGVPITGIDAAEALGCKVYHAGTAQKNAALVTAGGRVLGVTATANSIKDAVKLAYDGVGQINFSGAMYRKDIAHRALR